MRERPFWGIDKPIHACGQFSIANPDKPLRENLCFKISKKLHRATTGKEIWACEACALVLPRTKNPSEIGGMIKTACCNADIFIWGK